MNSLVVLSLISVCGLSSASVITPRTAYSVIPEPALEDVISCKAICQEQGATYLGVLDSTNDEHLCCLCNSSEAKTKGGK